MVKLQLSIFKNFQTQFSGSKTPCTIHSFNPTVVALDLLYHLVCSDFQQNQSISKVKFFFNFQGQVDLGSP
jgi:hypothetical protein